MDLSSVSVLIWDFDGTLYRADPSFHEAVIASAHRVVMEHRGWSKEKTDVEFSKIYKVSTPSSTHAAARLAQIPVAQAAIEVEWYKDRTTFLSPDTKLVALFQTLSGYTHYILANGIREKIIPALSILGLSQEIFSDIVTSEVVGVTKPAPDGFLYILQKTGLPPDAHVMIGDRESVDLAPAKELGMKTCLVWSETNSEIADITVPTVYDIVKCI